MAKQKEDTQQIQPSVTRLYQGLNMDHSPIDQPQGTYRYALNAVNESLSGQVGFLSNEESIYPTAYIPDGYKVLGNVLISDTEVVLFLVSLEETVSEIGLFDGAGYVKIVNDRESEYPLNFKITKQIEGVFRLRRGCERTIYFTDDYNKPRLFNLDKTEDFKDVDGFWDARKFDLQKSYSKIPEFEKVEVQDFGGSLDSGSYNVAVQYVDVGLNASEWVSVSHPINIYTEDVEQDTYKIKGSISSGEEFYQNGETSKSIKVRLSNLDSNYLFYRLAFVEATSGSGYITNVKATEPIPIERPYFTYTGVNAPNIISEYELYMFSDFIERAKTITQLENRLKLGNTQGKQINFCQLQRFASKIQADCVVRDTVLHDHKKSSHHPKNPICDFEGTGYMPGEIYSFGIVYILDDNSLSPVFHIPGKNPTKNGTYLRGTYPMSTDNQTENSYTERKSGYWGIDCEGSLLASKKVRHHRFPLRSEIGIPLMTTVKDSSNQYNSFCLKVSLNGNIYVPIPCRETEQELTEEEKEQCKPKPNFSIKVVYRVNNQEYKLVKHINPNEIIGLADSNTAVYKLQENTQFFETDQIEVLNVFLVDNKGVETDLTSREKTVEGRTVVAYAIEGDIYFDSSVDIEIEKSNVTSKKEFRRSNSKILGIQFSNIQIPILKEGYKIKGYYIVRQERTEQDKTILDSGVLVPTVGHSKYIAYGMTMPELDEHSANEGLGQIQNNTWAFINPECLFNDKYLKNFTEIIQEGYFNLDELTTSVTNFDDVLDGSAMNHDYHDNMNDDGQKADGQPGWGSWNESGIGWDGWSIAMGCRDHILSFRTHSRKGDNFKFKRNQIEEVFYLGGFQSKHFEKENKVVYNISADNKVGFLRFKEGTTLEYNRNKTPYVIFKRDIKSCYSDFRTAPYYKENLNPVYFKEGEVSTAKIYHGDIYVSPMRYVSSVFIKNQIARRATHKVSGWKIFWAIVGLVASVALAVFSGGSSLLLSAGLIGAGVSVLWGKSMIDMHLAADIYGKEYDKGLKHTVRDKYTRWRFSEYDTFSDDTIEWVIDCMTDLWFESPINMGLRHPIGNDKNPSFLNSPAIIETGVTWDFHKRNVLDNTFKDSNEPRYPITALEHYVSKKLLAPDFKRDDGKAYLGTSIPEFYAINPDYQRKNTQKAYFHLALEYDCCSECENDFPQRWHWSEQSFQEELSDNYRNFLSNNYKDVPGEYGEIRKLFVLNNELFVHSERALWHQPREIQERVTDQIVTFIGTGTYGDLPPKRLSSGLSYQWGSVITPQGYFFVCEAENSVYHFNGQQSQSISSNGLNNFFKFNSKVHSKGFRDNPSHLLGNGYIVTYDPVKERLIVAKKDITQNYNPEDVILHEGRLILFHGLKDTMENRQEDGWEYLGIENNSLKFQKVDYVTEVIDGLALFPAHSVVREERGRPERATHTMTRGEPGNVNDTRTNTRLIEKLTTEYVEGEVVENEPIENKSWTLSYALDNSYRKGHWVSFHSYSPNQFISTTSELYSWKQSLSRIYQHNAKTYNQYFYCQEVPFIVEYVSVSNPLSTKVWDSLTLQMDVEAFYKDYFNYYKTHLESIIKMTLYNSTQSSGEVTLIPNKGLSHVKLKPQQAIITCSEKDYRVNGFRNMRDKEGLEWIKPENNPFLIDKELNPHVFNYNKHWTEQESLRDKYLIIRLSFEERKDQRITINYLTEQQTPSYR